MITAAGRHQQWLANEEHGRLARAAISSGPLLGTTVEIQPRTDQPDWSSLDYATDVVFRSVKEANQAGLDGKKIKSVSISGCTQYGNLTVGFDFENDPPKVAA